MSALTTSKLINWMFSTTKKYSVVHQHQGGVESVRHFANLSAAKRFQNSKKPRAGHYWIVFDPDGACYEETKHG